METIRDIFCTQTGYTFTQQRHPEITLSDRTTSNASRPYYTIFSGVTNGAGIAYPSGTLGFTLRC